jgi:hypothetical protein
MRAGDTTTFVRGTTVHLVLSITNETGRAVGYLTNRETHFALVDQSNKTLWTDAQCGRADSTTTPPSYRALAPGEHVDLEGVYPGGDTCIAPAGNAYLTGALTVCLNLAPDSSCRGASDERVQAQPIAVTLS